MPLCEPITIEEDNDVKWIREIDLDDLPIERSCTYFRKVPDLTSSLNLNLVLLKCILFVFNYIYRAV
jgi:hypothetical protein